MGRFLCFILFSFFLLIERLTENNKNGTVYCKNVSNESRVVRLKRWLMRFFLFFSVLLRSQAQILKLALLLLYFLGNLLCLAIVCIHLNEKTNKQPVELQFFECHSRNSNMSTRLHNFFKLNLFIYLFFATVSNNHN